MPRRQEIDFPTPQDANKEFRGKHFIDEGLDKKEFVGFTFEFCTFEKIGLRETRFERCVFRHCEFLECYMFEAMFEHCNFIGSFFERCNFSWAKFPNSELDYTRFSHCAPVLQQIFNQKPENPQAATKFFRNLASEHKNLGNWQEVDRLIWQSYKERERHYYYALIGKNDHYRKRYNITKRISYGFRWLLSLANGTLWGYGVSWLTFARSFAIIGAVILPIVNSVFGRVVGGTAFSWKQSSAQDIFSHLSLVYRTTIQKVLPFITLSEDVKSTFEIPFFLVVTEAILGTIFIALFVSLLFRAASKGV